jgi:dsRNA-specific ribonuclease
VSFEALLVAAHGQVPDAARLLAAVRSRLPRPRVVRRSAWRELPGRVTWQLAAAAAVILMAGAVYLDGGFDAARRFLCGLLRSSLKPIKSETLTVNNSKSALQEICQKAGLPAPDYRLVSEKGPAHDRTFVVEVRLGDKVLAKSKGLSKKSAEQQAAEKVLKAFFGRKIKRISPEAFFIEAEDLVLP